MWSCCFDGAKSRAWQRRDVQFGIKPWCGIKFSGRNNVQRPTRLRFLLDSMDETMFHYYTSFTKMKFHQYVHYILPITSCNHWFTSWLVLSVGERPGKFVDEGMDRLHQIIQLTLYHYFRGILKSPVSVLLYLISSYLLAIIFKQCFLTNDVVTRWDLDSFNANEAHQRQLHLFLQEAKLPLGRRSQAANPRIHRSDRVAWSPLIWLALSKFLNWIIEFPQYTHLHLHEKINRKCRYMNIQSSHAFYGIGCNFSEEVYIYIHLLR